MVVATYRPIQGASLKLTWQEGLRLTGVNGLTYQIQTRPDLSSNTVWTNLVTITLSNATVVIPGTIPTNRGTLFYRALLQP